MAKGVLVIAPSGSGKSASLRNLDPMTTVIINVVDKDFPFKRNPLFKNITLKLPSDIVPGAVLSTSGKSDILGVLTHVSKNLPEVKNLVIDDFGYSAVNEYMSRINEKSFDKFNDIGNIYWTLARKIKSLREDLNVFVLAHDEVEVDSLGNRFSKFKTVGKITDKMIVFEGLFSIVLGATVIREIGKEPRYVFITKSDGTNTIKSPIGMFSEEHIDNDLDLVSKTITEYYK